MGWLKNKQLSRALEANSLIHDAIVMGIADKYIQEENLEDNPFGLNLLARALNWAIPRQDYVFEKDVEKVEDEESRRRFKEDEDQIFKKGLEILNSDPLIEKVATHYVAYQIFLINTLFPKAETKFPGIIRMRKFLAQTTEREPDTADSDFKKSYKTLFESFNDEYGKYGKTLEQKTIDSLFSLL